MLRNFIKKTLGTNGILFFRKIKYSFFNFFCSFFKMKKEIILESHPDLSCNTFELFRYMLENNINKKFHIVWLVNNPLIYSSYENKNIEFIQIKPTSLYNKIKLYIRCNRARIIITCNRHIPKYKTGKKQINIYIEHGSPIKYARPDIEGLSCGYYISQSHFFTPYLINELSIKENQIKNLGFPRNDQLFLNHKSLFKIIPNVDKFSKTIIWVPTFRKKILTGRISSNFKMPLGIPILYDIESLIKVNDFLKNCNILLLIKPHPAQDVTALYKFNLSNICLISNEQLISAQIQTNELLKQTDAMITDYSGIYFDYLLLDKPIAITIDDIDEYKKTTGFVFENPLNILKGYKILNVDNLLSFFSDVASNKDDFLCERKIVKELTNEYLDGKSSERVWHFIEEKYLETYKD